VFLVEVKDGEEIAATSVFGFEKRASSSLGLTTILSIVIFSVTD
jgi:hypothetical protein